MSGLGWPYRNNWGSGVDPLSNAGMTMEPLAEGKDIVPGAKETVIQGTLFVADGKNFVADSLETVANGLETVSDDKNIAAEGKNIVDKYRKQLLRVLRNIVRLANIMWSRK